ncbi:MAG: NAD(P)/FAD-dependent oxidoreductase [Alicyclobacillaceae bacterium]|nr:NAD(P)/FAD-dependent oxidoreductase [Alicyclobacillaceae bacterium]
MEKIVILGAGYAGLTTAQVLQRLRIPYVLVNDGPDHQFTALMHEVAGGRGPADQYRISLTELLDPDCGTLIIGRVESIDLRQRRVVVEGKAVDYDLLVVAIGSETDFFGIPGLKENSLPLWGLKTALAIRDGVRRVVATASPGNTARIVIGGGGLTGVELAGELAEWIPKLCQEAGVSRKAVEIVLIEAMDTILPMLGADLQQKALEALKQKGVDVRTGMKVVEAKAAEVRLENAPPLEYTLLIWTGGVRGNSLLASSGFEVDRKGRVPVDASLRPPGLIRVFVIGDGAAFAGPDGRPFPPTAQLAVQMGRHTAYNLERLVYGRPLLPFRPRMRGTLASIGPADGIGELGSWKVAGWAARFLKEANKARYLWNIGGWRILVKRWGQIRWA